MKKHFVGYMELENSRTGTYIINNEEQIFDKKIIVRPNLGSKFKLVSEILFSTRRDDLFIVLCPSHLLAIYLRILLRKHVILDAGWSLTESAIYRGKGWKRKLVRLRIYLIDFIAFKSAKILLVESKKQREYLINKFLIKNNKVIILETGVNEYRFSKIPKNYNYLSNQKNIILFRGKNNAEAGFELLTAISWQLPRYLKLLVVTDHIEKDQVFSPRTILKVGKVSDEIISAAYNRSDIVLGQLAQSPRIRNTIPHKAYEAAYFGKTYISQESPAMREVFPTNSQIVYLESLELNYILNTIKFVLKNKELQKTYEREISIQYARNFCQNMLQLKFNEILRTYIKKTV